MRKSKILIFIIAAIVSSCENEEISPRVSDNSSELLWLRNDGFDMPVLIEGNTASNIFILFLHGGPSDGAILINNYFEGATNKLEKHFAMAYWDQRGIGESVGRLKNKQLNRLQYLEDLEKLIILLKHRYGNNIQLFLMGHSWGGILGQSYLVKHNKEQNIKGWIEIGSLHSVTDMKIFGKQRLKMIADEQIQKGKSIEQWKEYKNMADNYCADCINTHADINKYFQLTIPAEQLAYEDGEIKSGCQARLSYIFYRFESILEDEVSVEDKVIADFSDFDISSELYKIEVPSLFIFGKYDIHVPIELAYKAKELYGTPPEDFHIKEFKYSDHSPLTCEPLLFQETVIEFINQYKTP